jgi:hypothetical protein
MRHMAISANRRHSHVAQVGRMPHDQAARIGSTDARRLAAAHGLRPVSEECSGTSDKSGFATAGSSMAPYPPWPSESHYASLDLGLNVEPWRKDHPLSR